MKSNWSSVTGLSYKCRFLGHDNVDGAFIMIFHLRRAPVSLASRLRLALTTLLTSASSDTAISSGYYCNVTNVLFFAMSSWFKCIGDFFTIGICPPRVRVNFCLIELKSLDYRHVLYFRKALDARMSEMMFRRYIGNISV